MGQRRNGAAPTAFALAVGVVEHELGPQPVVHKVHLRAEEEHERLGLDEHLRRARVSGWQSGHSEESTVRGTFTPCCSTSSMNFCFSTQYPIV